MQNIKFKIFKKFQKKDIYSFISLTRKNYSESHVLTNKYLIIHKYLNYPIQPTFISTLNDGNITEGRVCYISNSVIYQNKKIQSLSPQDFVINKEHRSPFTNIIKIINIPKKFLKNFFIIHTGNENSNKLYELILKYPKYFKIEFNIIIINPIFFMAQSIFIKKIMIKIYSFLLFGRDKSIKLKEGNITDKEFNNMNKSYVNVPKFDRSEDFYRWRLKFIKHNKLKIYKEKKLKGYVTLAHLKYKNKNITLIFDYFIMDSVSKKEMKSVIIEIIKVSAEFSDFIFLTGNQNSPIFKKFNIFPFTKIPETILPHSSYFYGRNTNINIKDINNFHHCLIDQDWF